MNMKQQYKALSVTDLTMQMETAVLSGSIVTSDTTISPATQEKGIDIDLSSTGFNHEWE